MPRDGQTGIVIPVPEANPLLSAVAARFPDAVREGVPAHVSVLYPFLPDRELDDRVVGSLAELFARTSAMSVKLSNCCRHGDFVFMRPEPADAVRELTGEIRRRWPRVVPYEGLYEDVGAHLTVALHTTSERASAVEREIVPRWVPVAARLREAWLLAFVDGRWTVRQRCEFSAGSTPRRG